MDNDVKAYSPAAIGLSGFQIYVTQKFCALHIYRCQKKIKKIS